jgi:hypothetical protein
MTTVTIGGREFRLGAWYVSKHPNAKPKQLLGFEPTGYQPGGTVHFKSARDYERGEAGRWWSAARWAGRAGDEVLP